jgi:Domain of unknown function (DUF4331)
LRRALLHLALGSAALGCLSMPVARASSHREAPLIAEDPLADNTDVYAFVSPADPTKVTLIANFVPLQTPYGGPNFYRFGDDVLYEIKVDNDGDAREDITFQFRFNTVTRNGNTFLYNTGQITSLDSPNWNRPQFYSVSMVRGSAAPIRRRPGLSQPMVSTTLLATNLPTPPSNIGTKSIPNYPALATAAVRDIGNGIKAFAGQRDEGFYVDLGGIFDLLNIRSPGQDKTAGLNVSSIAIEVPKTLLTRNGTAPTSATDSAAVIGIWSTASRARTRVLEDGGSSGSGGFVQVSRLGMPLVNEVVIPLGQKDHFNASQPKDDGQFLSFVQNPELGRLFQAGALTLNGSPVSLNVPPAPRTDLVTIFLTGIPGLNQPPNVVPSEMLRLNVAIPPSANPNRLGILGGDLAGFPNGRRVGDDTVDIAIRAVAGATPFTPAFNISPNNILGDFVDGNDVPYLNVFPYLGLPHDGFVTD